MCFSPSKKSISINKAVPKENEIFLINVRWKVELSRLH